MGLKFNMLKGRTTEIEYLGFPNIEEKVVSQAMFAAVFFTFLLSFCCFNRGMRNLAIDLREEIEETNDEDRESNNYDKRRRAYNMDKMEEIYDKIVTAKNRGVKTRVFENTNVD